MGWTCILDSEIWNFGVHLLENDYLKTLNLREISCENRRWT
jgi:hypothetical protein